MRWLLILTLACSRPAPDESEILAGKRAVTVDVKQLATPAELLHALQLPGSELDRVLGARRVEARSSIKVEPPGRPVEKIDETFSLDSDAKGAVHLVHDNARDGLEAVILGNQIFSKPRYGHWTKRRAEGDDVERLRENVEGVAFGYLELLSRWLVVKEIGRDGQKLKLALSAAASPSGSASETLPQRKWRETLKVRSINGEWLVDAASGASLGGKLEASYTFERSDLKGPVVVTLDYQQQAAAQQPIAPPEGAVEPKRTRPMLDRETLLDGLAPVKQTR